MLLPHYSILFVALTICLPVINGQTASVREESEKILTYPYSDPDPVPVMAINPTVSPFYPYYVFDGYTEKGTGQNWKIISLDNDLINVTVLPEVGGKIWGATEKSTGLEFIYRNHVMKFRAIGIRGPWTSGGIEHNFGLDLGHAPWTAAPVDYIVRNNPDGSVSCTVGGLDLASETEWRVNIILQPGKAFFVTKSIWYNPTPLHDAYLSWENAGFKASGNLQFFFPGNYYIGHDGSVSPWPVDKEGRDLSWYNNNNFGASKSYHVSGYFTDWFGGYWHDYGFGFAHSAPYSDAPGKKIWIWSLARDGAIWENLLTDKDGQYIEAQSGVKFNQANRESGFNSPFDQLSMRPHYTDSKTEYWFPVMKTKGIADASEYGAMNIIKGNDSLEIIISPNAAIKDSLYLFEEGKQIYSEPVSLIPLKIFSRKLPIDLRKSGKVSVKLGYDLLEWTSDSSALLSGRPAKSSGQSDFTSPEHFFRLAEDMNAMRDYDNALENYRKCLSTAPDHNEALYRVAELFYRRTEYDSALYYAGRITENNTYDGAGNFITGMIKRISGNLVEAEEAYSVAARTMEYRSAAYVEIAGLKMQRKDFTGAATYALKSLDYNNMNIQAYEILGCAYRKLNMAKKAEDCLNILLEKDPLGHFARFEMYLADPDDEKLRNFTSLIRNELPHETYLELASFYNNMGLGQDAVRVLEASPANPVVNYWLAYLLRNADPGKSETYLNKAVSMSPRLVFPHRRETIPVLEWAVSQNDSWKSKYYLGLIFWHLHRYDKTAELFERCGDIPDYAPFYISRGELFKTLPSTYCHPCSDFETAVKMDPSEWRTWHYLGTFLRSNGAFSEELKNAETAFAMFPSNPVIGTDYAKALLNTGKYAECDRILAKLKILPQEGAHECHDIFEQNGISLALASADRGKIKEALRFTYYSRRWPENLGAGRPFDPDSRMQDLLTVYFYDKLGDKRLAESYRRKIADFTVSTTITDQDPCCFYIGLKTMQGLGMSDEAGKLLTRWRTVQDSLSNWNLAAGSSSAKARWLIAIMNNENEKASDLEKEISAIPAENRFRLMQKAYKLIYGMNK